METKDRHTTMGRTSTSTRPYTSSTPNGLGSEVNEESAFLVNPIDRAHTNADIRLFMDDNLQRRTYSPALIRIVLGDKSMEGLALGGALGGVLFGLAGALYFLNTTVIFIGGYVFSGAILAGFLGVGIGSIIGGVLGTLIGMFFEEERATIVETAETTKTRGTTTGTTTGTTMGTTTNKNTERML